MRYEDLSVAIEPKPEGGYQARALASPFGPGTAPFDLPLRREELEELIRKVSASVLAPSNVRDLASARDLMASGDVQHPSEILRRIRALGEQRADQVVIEAHGACGSRARSCTSRTRRHERWRPCPG